MFHIVGSGGLLSEIEVAQRTPVAAPCPVGPRPDDQMERSPGALAQDGFVKVPGPVAILGVERAAHDQHRGTDVVAGPARVARAPPLVVVGMFGHLLPERIGCQQFRQVSPRGALREEERAFVGRDRQPAPRHLVGRLVSSGRVHRIEEPHGVAQHQHAVVVHVVAHVPVRNGGLRRNGLHGRMPAQTAHQGVESRVGASRETHTAVVAGNVLHQPVHRIVAVRRLVHAAEARGTHVHELALAHVAAPDVLLDDDVAAVDVTAHVAFFETAGKLSLAVRSRTVRRPENDYRGLAGGLGREDRGVQAHAVAHGDTVFGLVVKRADRLGARSGRYQQSRPEQEQKSA